MYGSQSVPQLEVVMGGAAGGARKREAEKASTERKGTSVRLTWQTYERLRMLAAMRGPDTSLSDALEWMFEQQPEVLKAVDRALSEGRRIAQ